MIFPEKSINPASISNLAGFIILYSYAIRSFIAIAFSCIPFLIRKSYGIMAG
jgi:hypothetical protein